MEHADTINMFSVFCPYIALLAGLSDIYWDNLADYWILFASVAFYLGTTAYAVVIAKRWKFKKYELKVAYNVPSILLGCIFSWIICIPYFLHNKSLVSSGQATLRHESSRHSGGAYFALVLWPVICFLWLGATLPCMLQSPKRANEATAVTCVRNYGTAQVTYSLTKPAAAFGGADERDKYCDNFRNLYYGRSAEGNRLQLISQSMADAFAHPTSGTPAPPEAPIASKPYQGYVFLEDPYVANNRLWKNEYSLIAYPARPGRTGDNLFWMDSNGQILKRKCKGETFRLLTEEESPFHPEARKLWEEL